MTLILAAKVPSNRLNPKQRPLRFEPGLILVSDTRFTWSSAKPAQDDGRKWWSIGDRSFAAFAGDVELAEKTIIFAREACLEHHRVDEKYSGVAIQTLGRWFKKNMRATGSTEIVYGIRNEAGRFKMFLFKSDNEFEPEERDGIVAMGSGRKFVEARIDANIDALMYGFYQRGRLKLVPRGDGEHSVEELGPSDTVPISIFEILDILGIVADEAVQQSGISTVGGRVSALTLTDQGLKALKMAVLDEGASDWRLATPNFSLRGLAEATNRTYTGPLLNPNGDITLGQQITLSTKPPSKHL